jgi:hypothetical protein
MNDITTSPWGPSSIDVINAARALEHLPALRWDGQTERFVAATDAPVTSTVTPTTTKCKR